MLETRGPQEDPKSGTPETDTTSEGGAEQQDSTKEEVLTKEESEAVERLARTMELRSKELLNLNAFDSSD